MAAPNRSTVLMGLAAAVAAAAAFMLLHQVYRSEVDAQRGLLLERGQTILDALAAGVRAQTRMGRYRDEHLASVFEELAATPGVRALQLETREGVPVAGAGETALFPPEASLGASWTGPQLIMARTARFTGDRSPRGPGFGFGRGPGFGRGRGPGPGGGPGGESPPAMAVEEEAPWGPDEYILRVALDTGGLAAAIRRARLQFVLSSAALAAVLGLGTVLVATRTRHRTLQTELVVAQERARQHEELSQLGAGLAHETKNPLGVVRGLAQSILEEPTDRSAAEGGGPTSRTKEMARAIVDEADRTVGQINAFLALARPAEPEPAPLDMDNFMRGFLPLLKAEAHSTAVEVTYAPSQLTVLADESQFRRLLMNLVSNGVRACGPGGGRVSITLAPHGRDAVLVVEDNGRGIAPEDLPRITQPYFSRFDGGTGLGLSIVDAIVRAHGWRLTFSSAAGKGSAVYIEGLRQVSSVP